jgi:hypothetical protein
MNAGQRSSALDASTVVLDEVLLRVQAEFLEMPGLRVTRAQARRLWALVDAHFLVESRNASFTRASDRA